AGVVRPEALRSLEGLDNVLGLLERVAGHAPRPYHFVVLSDHGQSQGATYLQRCGESLQDTVRSLLADGEHAVAAATGAVEAWGPVNVFLSQLTEQRSVTGSMTRRVLRSRTSDGTVRLGPGEREESAIEDGRPEVVVVGSGNLGGVWFAREPGRLTLEELQLLHPAMVPGLVRRPEVGFVVVDTAAHGAVAIGAAGVHRLEDGVVEGTDPLAAFGRYAAADLRHIAGYTNAPDLYVNSSYDAVLDEVAAFEELVGCHGGLGGWQTRPILIRPADWALDEDLLTDGTIRGAEVLHVQLVRWLERLGHRAGLLPRAAELDLLAAGPQLAEDLPGSGLSQDRADG
ncbi:MAG TPA: hypothetical protein VFN19_04375, partial [Candidatus Nanopelagicales bacterium]|nr:hypothetical protein [Candidatus Nanopelagicales bacterium]